ncbi:MAG: hypothetical protein MUF23_02480 [Pirellula sp.]|jgi:hypothetical protein|nr:hypothetical protein [Pirellula sp.]
MDVSSQPSDIALGFVAVRQRTPHGFFGGYLVINARARPLEFHCTLPVQPTRAQQILFGSTLTEYLCGEVIAKALLQKSTAKPQVVLTDCKSVLAVRHWLEQPILFVESDSMPTSSEDDFDIPAYERSELQYSRRVISGITFSCLAAFERDLDHLKVIEQLSDLIDFVEPFTRIVEALSEAHPRTRAA